MENFFLYLKGRGITLYNIQFLTENDINDIFGNNIGIKAQFRAFINDYRLSKNLPPLHCCPCSNKATSSEYQTKSTLCSSDSVTNEDLDFNIHQFMLTDIGKKLQSNYEANKQCFRNEERDFMVSSIVQSYLVKNTPMTQKTMDKISGQIVSVFKNEQKDYYFSMTPYAKGKIYTKYRAMSAAYKKSGIFNAVIRNKKTNASKSSLATSTEQCKENGEQDDSPKNQDVEWLQNWVAPWSVVETKWKSTFSVRQRDINGKSNDTDILKRWPLFKHVNGARLIDIDFEEKFPGKGDNFLRNFKSIENKLQQIFDKNIKYGPGRAMMMTLSDNIEYRRFQQIKLLNTLVKPVGRKKVDGTIWKVSISDAWNSILTKADTVADIATVLNDRKNFCVKKKIIFQPIVVVVGDENSPQFLIATDNFVYNFNSFINAFDIFFKLFFVLNYEFPFENSKFLNFIQEFFYEIPCPIDISDIKTIFKE